MTDKILTMNIIRTQPSQQQGIAMLSALLVVALATVIAVTMIEKQQYKIRRLENVIYNQQAYYYALAGEAWARSILFKDKASSSHKNTDNLFEDWAQPLPVTTIEGGTIAGEITDLQGLFNLNNLHDPTENSTPGPELSAQIEMFKNLLSLIGLQPSMSQVVLDWLDPDADIRFPDGAEDQSYQQKDPPYLTANTPFRSVSELLLLEGMTYEDYEKLKPFVTVLPVATKININTAPAAVIAALHPDIDLSEATAFVEDREAVIESVDEFLNDTEGYANDKTAYRSQVAPLIDVKSDYFQVKSSVQIDKVTRILHSKLFRNSDDKLELISRSPGVD